MMYISFGDPVEDEKSRQRAYDLEARIRNMKRESMKRHYEKWDAIWRDVYGNGPQEDTIDVECVVVEPPKLNATQNC